MGPRESQTGPALRKDMKVIEKHLSMLRKRPEAYELYKKISDNIIDQSED